MGGKATEKEAVIPDQLTLALERTYLAHERTLMAWTRTATSLITFGFTLYKFFEFLHEGKEAVHHHRLLGVRNFGMVMIGIGVFTLIVSSAQHHVQMRRLKAAYPDAPFSLALILSCLIAFLGVLGIVSGVIYPSSSEVVHF